MAILGLLLDAMQAATAAHIGLPDRLQGPGLLRNNSAFRETYAADLAQLQEQEAIIANLRKSNQAKLEKLGGEA